MARRIKKLKLDELSLVDDGANDGARVLVVKRRAQDHNARQHSTDDDLAARLAIIEKAIDRGNSAELDALRAALAEKSQMDLNEMHAALTTATARIDSLTGEVRKRDDQIALLTKSLTDATAAVEAAREETAVLKAKVDPKGAEEDILKSLPPAARALVEATRSQAAMIEKRAGEIERAERIAKAKEDGIQKPDEIADLISKIAKGVAGQAEADAVYAILKGNSAALRDAALFRPVGSSGATATTGAMGEIATRVAKLRSEKPTMSEAVAMDAVLSADPGLYQRYRQENITGAAR